MIDYLLSLPSYIPMLVVAISLAVSLGGLLIKQIVLSRLLEFYEKILNRCLQKTELMTDKISEAATIAYNQQITGLHNVLAQHRKDILLLEEKINKKAIQPKAHIKKSVTPVKPRKRVNGGAHVSR